MSEFCWYEEDGQCVSQCTECEFEETRSKSHLDSMPRLNYWLWVSGAFQWQWARKFHGGHFESWYNDVTHSAPWEPRPYCSKGTHWRPPCCFGTPICEDWPKR